MDSESLHSTMNRRDFLKASGTGLVGAILLGTTSGRVLTRQRTSLKAEFSLAAAKHKVPIDRRHIIGHNQVPGCPGAGGGISCHTDPGRHWDWRKYMRLIRHYR